MGNQEMVDSDYKMMEYDVSILPARMWLKAAGGGRVLAIYARGIYLIFKLTEIDTTDVNDEALLSRICHPKKQGF